MDDNKKLMETTFENSKKKKPSIDEKIIEHIDNTVVGSQVIPLPNVEQPICETSMD